MFAASGYMIICIEEGVVKILIIMYKNCNLRAANLNLGHVNLNTPDQANRMFKTRKSEGYACFLVVCNH